MSMNPTCPTEAEPGDAEQRLTSILRTLAEELARQHRVALDLQETVSCMVMAERLRNTDIAKIQKLDSLSQSLENLWRVTDIIATRPAASLTIQDITDAVTLGELRARLAAHGSPSCNGVVPRGQAGARETLAQTDTDGSDCDVNWL